MNYTKWMLTNFDQLSINYKNSNIKDSELHIFCEYVYVGIINKCWLPPTYTIGIINN